MAGTLTVQNIEGPSSGANANKIIIPSGQTLIPSSGGIIQVQKSSIRYSASTTTSTSYAKVSGSYDVTITPKTADSYILAMFSYHAVFNRDTYLAVQIHVDDGGGFTSIHSTDNGNETHRFSLDTGSNNDRISTRAHLSGIYDSYTTTGDLTFSIFYKRTAGSNTARINDVGGGSFLTLMEIAQ